MQVSRCARAANRAIDHSTSGRGERGAVLPQSRTTDGLSGALMERERESRQTRRVLVTLVVCLLIETVASGKDLRRAYGCRTRCARGRAARGRVWRRGRLFVCPVDVRNGGTQCPVCEPPPSASSARGGAFPPPLSPLRSNFHVVSRSRSFADHVTCEWTVISVDRGMSPTKSRGAADPSDGFRRVDGSRRCLARRAEWSTVHFKAGARRFPGKSKKDLSQETPSAHFNNL